MLFRQRDCVRLKPMQADAAPHDQPHMRGDGLAEGQEGHQLVALFTGRRGLISC